MFTILRSLLKKIRQRFNEKDDIRLLESSDLFDKDWYLTHNPDVANAKVNPLLHYLQHGGFEGRNPSSDFSSSGYLEAYEDVKNAGMNPLVHYLKYGKNEGRNKNIVKPSIPRSNKMIAFVTDDEHPHAGGNIRFGDHNTFTPSLWSQLVDRFAVRSMLDVGCGEGHSVRFFHRLGIIAHGIDGLEKNILRAVHPIAYHDLNTGPYRMPVDFVLSIEVAEHIDEKYVDNYLDTLCNGNVVAMTHATPDQIGGYHHVNCQPSQYWIDKFVARGYRLDYYNDYWRNQALKEREESFFGSSGLVFVKND